MRQTLAAAGLAVLTLLGCQPVAKTTDLPPVGAELMAIQMQDCQKLGGTFRPVKPGGSLACFTVPKDAGQSCKASTDCESACLARSLTCAPVKPLFGCNEVLNSGGFRVSQCIE
jgi:hypothetical protein